jgi:hypothetical protein
MKEQGVRRKILGKTGTVIWKQKAKKKLQEKEGLHQNRIQASPPYRNRKKRASKNGATI